MGDRALIQMKSGNEFSPILYMHNGGYRVNQVLEATEAQMKGRPGDVSYAFARTVQNAIGNDKGNLGFGVWNAESLLMAGDSHGDAGCFVVDVSESKWVVYTGGGYGIEGKCKLKIQNLD